MFFISCLLLSACAKEVAVYDKSPTNPSANAPAPVSGGYPMYPREAALRGIEGWVKVQFTISGDDSVKDAVVLDANPEGVFDEFARATAASIAESAASPTALGVWMVTTGSSSTR